MATHKTRTPLFLVMVGGILILTSLLIFFQTLAVPTPTATPTFALYSGPLPLPEVTRIGVGDAKAAYDLQAAVFVDVRGDPYYGAGHIPGARNLTEETVLAGLADLPLDTWIILYCT